MNEEASSAAAKRERIKAISRTVHSIPVEEGGQLRSPPRAVVAPALPKPGWKNAALAVGGAGALALGFVAGLVAGRRR